MNSHLSFKPMLTIMSPDRLSGGCPLSGIMAAALLTGITVMVCCACAAELFITLPLVVRPPPPLLKKVVMGMVAAWGGAAAPPSGLMETICWW